MRSIIPNATNEVIGLVKGASVVFVIAIPELFYAVQVIYNRNSRVIPLLLVAVVWYTLITTILSVGQYYIERYYSRGSVRVLPPTPFQRFRRWVSVQWARLGDSPAPPPLPEPAAIVQASFSGSRNDAKFSGGAADEHHHPHPGPDPDPRARRDPQRPQELRRPRSAGGHRPHGAARRSRRDPRPSGSGKSTLLRTINHLESVDRGSVTVDGQLIGYERRGEKLYELREKEILKRRIQIGIVFQNFNLFPHLTAVENIIEAPVATGSSQKDAARELALKLLERVGLSDKADHYPRQLSGGQQQRVAIARALALSPKVLLFDEPTSALDPELVGEVLDVIRDLARSGTTLIIVTHEIGFAREVADRIVFVDGGRILEAARPRGPHQPGAPAHAGVPRQSPGLSTLRHEASRNKRRHSTMAISKKQGIAIGVGVWRSPLVGGVFTAVNLNNDEPRGDAAAAAGPSRRTRRPTRSHGSTSTRCRRLSRRWRRAASSLSRPASSPSPSAPSCPR